MSEPNIVIVGAGHAGVQAAASLREEGFAGAITLLSNEPDFPYQRPPLSKAFLKGQMELAGLPLRGEKFFDEQRIDLRLGVAATRIDRAGRQLELGGGGAAPYDHLILATGSRARRIPLPGVELANVLELRTIADANRLKAVLGAGKRLAVVGT